MRTLRARIDSSSGDGRAATYSSSGDGWMQRRRLGAWMGDRFHSFETPLELRAAEAERNWRSCADFALSGAVEGAVRRCATRCADICVDQCRPLFARSSSVAGRSCYLSCSRDCYGRCVLVICIVLLSATSPFNLLAEHVVAALLPVLHLALGAAVARVAAAAFLPQ